MRPLAPKLAPKMRDSWHRFEMGEKQLIVPSWEKHELSADCFCEPTIESNGKLIIHHAKVCKGGERHQWRRGKCRTCGQRERSVFAE